MPISSPGSGSPPTSAPEPGRQATVAYGNVADVTGVDQRRRNLPWIALGVVYVLWGSTYLANRYIIVSMPPLLASGFRFMTGGVLLGLLVLVFAGPRAFGMSRAQFGTAALSGLLLPAWGNGLVIVAQSQVASGLTALLIASVPLYIAVLRALTGDRPRRATVLGVLVGAVGLALLVLVGPSGDRAGCPAAPGGDRRSCCSPARAGRRARSRPPAWPCPRTPSPSRPSSS